MSNKKILIAEISGKRPGGVEARNTESFDWAFDKVIISNNSDGYETDWPIVDVPEDYKEWYINNIKTNDKAYYAPMNRSYAIKWAKEQGYDYLVQLDDNILKFEMAYAIEDATYYSYGNQIKDLGLHNAMVEYMADVLDNTNVGVVGMALAGLSVPIDQWLSERYVYSFFMMNLKRVPDFYHGDFEDDIEFRLKMKQMKIPMLQIVPFRYTKTSQRATGDVSGNRQAYADVGVGRGDTMAKIYGDTYERGMSNRGSGMARREGLVDFRHKLKPFKIGVQVKNLEFLKQRMVDIFEKFAIKRKDKLQVVIHRPTIKRSFKVVDESNYLETLLIFLKLALEFDFTIEQTEDNKVVISYEETKDIFEIDEAVQGLLTNEIIEEVGNND